MSEIKVETAKTTIPPKNKFITKVKGLFENQEMLIFATFLVLCLIMSLVSEQFLTGDNLTNVARQISINAILAVGMTFVIITGGIDLSVGSVMAFTGTIMAGMMLVSGIPIYLAVLIGIVLGTVIGYINGMFVAYAKIPSIIVTLAMMEATRGLALLYTGGYPLSGLPDTFTFIGRGYAFGVIPMPVVIMVVVYLLAYVILNHMPLGRYIYAIGGNEEAVRLSGIKVKRYKIMAYAISGVTAAIAGMILTSRLASGQPNAGVGFELDAIAAVVLGGTAIAGGRGHIFGTLLGALLMGVLSNGLNLMGVSPYVQLVLKGAIILGAICYSSWSQKD